MEDKLETYIRKLEKASACKIAEISDSLINVIRELEDEKRKLETDKKKMNDENANLRQKSKTLEANLMVLIKSLEEDNKRLLELLKRQEGDVRILIEQRELSMSKKFAIVNSV